MFEYIFGKDTAVAEENELKGPGVLVCHPRHPLPLQVMLKGSRERQGRNYPKMATLKGSQVTCSGLQCSNRDLFLRTHPR